MTLIQPIGIPSDICLCRDLEEDHVPECIVIEDGIQCLCTWFTSGDEYWRHWFAEEIVVEEEDEGRYNTI